MNKKTYKTEQTVELVIPKTIKRFNFHGVRYLDPNRNGLRRHVIEDNNLTADYKQWEISQKIILAMLADICDASGGNKLDVLMPPKIRPYGDLKQICVHCVFDRKKYTLTKYKQQRNPDGSIIVDDWTEIPITIFSTALRDLVGVMSVEEEEAVIKWLKDYEAEYENSGELPEWLN